MSTAKGDTGKFKTLGIEDSASAKRRIPVKSTPSKFDPYQGTADKPASRKRDLRKIDEWLKAKRLADELKNTK